MARMSDFAQLKVSQVQGNRARMIPGLGGWGAQILILASSGVPRFLFFRPHLGGWGWGGVPGFLISGGSGGCGILKPGIILARFPCNSLLSKKVVNEECAGALDWFDRMALDAE